MSFPLEPWFTKGDYLLSLPNSVLPLTTNNFLTALKIFFLFGQ